MRTRLALTMLSALTIACGDGVVEAPVPPPPVAVGAWRANAVHDLPLPATMYVWGPHDAYGYPASTHLLLDSAHFEIHDDSTYLHRIWASEWEGPVGGGPTTKRGAWFHGDYGVWTRAADSLAFESGYLQNHRMIGILGPDAGTLRMRHGFTHGDERVAVRYTR